MEIIRSNKIIHKKPKREDYPYASSAKLFHTKQLFLYSEQVEPHQKSSAPHFHKEIDEIIYITKGELYAYEGKISQLLKEGDSVCFFPNSKEKHYLENKSNTVAEFLIFRRTHSSDDVIY